jgi:hypothetical protein
MKIKRILASQPDPSPVPLAGESASESSRRPGHSPARQLTDGTGEGAGHGKFVLRPDLTRFSVSFVSTFSFRCATLTYESNHAAEAYRSKYPNWIQIPRAGSAAPYPGSPASPTKRDGGWRHPPPGAAATWNEAYGNKENRRTEHKMSTKRPKQCALIFP